MEEQYSKSALDKFRQWHFWWLVVFSFLLIITFVYYLPTMFLSQSMLPHDGAPMGMPIDESQPHGHDGPGNSVPNTSPASGMDDEMHQHMDGHTDGGMSMDEMTEHMMEVHDMTEEEADQMMDEMMGHEHEEGMGHEQSGVGGVVYNEEADVKAGIAVNLNVNPVPYNSGTPLRLDFFVNEKPGNVPVPESSLELNHTKKIHVVGLRSDMNEFFHIHPEPVDNSGVFSINHTFNKPGLYKIWSDVKRGGVIYLFGHPEINVNGAGSKQEKNVSFSRNFTAGNYQVSLVTDDAVVKDRGAVLSFDIHTLNGQEVSVEDYLGAQMHLVLVKDDLKQFIHAHPEGAGHEHSSNTIINTANAQGDGHMDHDHGGTTSDAPSTGDEVISFTAVFPEAGLYKAFAQFRPQGIDMPADEALLAEFWIQVEEKAPFPVSQWWGLLLVSIILTAALSWVVNNYLKVKSEDVKVNK